LCVCFCVCCTVLRNKVYKLIATSAPSYRCINSKQIKQSIKQTMVPQNDGDGDSDYKQSNQLEMLGACVVAQCWRGIPTYFIARQYDTDLYLSFRSLALCQKMYNPSKFFSSTRICITLYRFTSPASVLKFQG